MRGINTLWGAAGLVVAASQPAAAQVAAAPPAASAASAQQPATLEEIVVTASRRNESIRTVPTAVSAFDGRKLREAQVASLNDLAAITPNVQISTFETNANISIRGIGNGNFIQAGGDPGVAVHQDGVYLGQSALALMTFMDVARVEVLRGPQGTLFGRNATGGAVNIISNAPTTDMHYGADVSAGADPTMVRSSAYVSGPLDGSDKILARLSVEQDYNQGYSRNHVAGAPERLDGINDVAARLQLEWLPTESLSFRLIGEYQKDKDSGPAAYLSGTPSGPAVFPFPLAPLLGLGTIAPITPPASSIGNPNTRDAEANLGSRHMTAKTVTLLSDWSVFGGHLKGTASYNESYNSDAQDGDGTSVPFTASIFTNKARQEYAELLYTSDSNSPLSTVFGANYFHENLVQNAAVPVLNLIPAFPYFNGGIVNTTSYAVFGHAQYMILPSTRIFGGLRYSHDHKQESEYVTLGVTNADQNSKSWQRVTYEVGASSDLTKNITGYAKYATGYKSGGYSVSSFNPPFNPETNTSIEAGVKGTFLNGGLQANLAAFNMGYRDLQVTQVLALGTAVTNAGRATINGVELESVLRPIHGLRVEFNAAWLDAKFDQFKTEDSARPLLGALNLASNELPNAPHWSGSLGAFYDFPISSGVITPGARVDWKSRTYFSEFNLPVSSQGANARLNLYLNYRSADGRWTGSLFALNATDTLVRSNVVVVSAVLGSLAVTQYQPGRQIGASVGYHF